MEEALIAMERARRLHGTDVIEALRIEALVALFSGKFAPAVARLEDVSRLSSQPIGDTYLALAYYYSGSGARGRSLLESLASHSSATTSARAGVSLAGVLAAQGDAAGARAQLDRVLARPYRDHHVAYGLGAAYAQLGRCRHRQPLASDCCRHGLPLLAMVRARSAAGTASRPSRVRRAHRLRARPAGHRTLRRSSLTADTAILVRNEPFRVRLAHSLLRGSPCARCDDGQRTRDTFG